MTTITIGNETIIVDVIGEVSSTALDKVPERIAHFGVLLGDAEAEKITGDALYRKWRAEQGNELRRRERNLSEWRVKQKTEAQDAYYNFKLAEAACERNVTILRNLIAALAARVRVRDPNPKRYEEE